MGLDERALGSSATMIAYGLTGVLLMIPALQEISLDRKLNEEKTKLEKNAFHPDLVARYIQNNGAVFIGCGQEAAGAVRQELTQGGVPFITVTSSMIEDESKRPPYFFTVIIRDVDAERAAGLLKGIIQDTARDSQGREGQEKEWEEDDLEREIGKEGLGEAEEGAELDGQQEGPEDGDDGVDEEEGLEDDDEEERKKDKKASAAKRKAERRQERRRQDEEKKRQDGQRRDDAARRGSAAQDAARRDTAASAERRTKERQEDSARAIAGAAVAAYTQPSIDYREAYAIQASQIEEQCERFAKAELMRRELERMKLSGEDASDAYDLLQDQYRSMNDDIRAHHDNFQSIGKGGWQEYAAEAAQRAREASTRDLKEHTWNVPESQDYLKQNRDGSYGAYTREEKKSYLDSAYRNGEANVTLHGYAEEAERHEALRRQEELISASRDIGTPEGMGHYRSLLDKYNVTDQEVSRYNGLDTVKRAREEFGRMLEETEKRLEGQGFTGVKEYRKQLEEALQNAPSRELAGGSYRIQYSRQYSGPQGGSAQDGPQGGTHARHGWKDVDTQGRQPMGTQGKTAPGEASGGGTQPQHGVPYGGVQGRAVGRRISAGPDPSASIKGPNGRPVVDFRSQKFSQAAYEALPEQARAGKPAVSFTRIGGGDPSLKQAANGYALQSYLELHGSSQVPRYGVYGGLNSRVAAPGCGGVLVGAGISVVAGSGCRRQGTAADESFKASANPQLIAAADVIPCAYAGFTGSTARTQAASVKALSSWQVPAGAGQPLPEGAKAEGDQSVQMGRVRESRMDSLRRVEAVNARASHAATNMLQNRYLAMVVKQGSRSAMQSATGDTDAGRMMSFAMSTVYLPAHIVKQKLLNACRTSLDQKDMAMSALNRHIIHSRADQAAALQGDALEKFALKSGATAKEFQAVKGDRAAMEQLLASRYAGTFKVPEKGDMEGIIRAMGIRGDLVEDGSIGTADILGFLGHHGETTMAERSRALKNAEGSLDGLTRGQKRLVESLFLQDKFLDQADMKAFLEKNGITGNLANRLSGGSWAANGDILAVLRQVGIQEDVAGVLMKELKGVSMEDRSAMMGLFQLYAGDRLDGFDMDKFRELLNVLDVDNALKDELANDYIHLSHMSIADIKKLLAKYKGNPEAEAFLSRLMNEKVCLVLGRNREMSQFEFMNAMESILFKMARGTDAMAGFSQVMGFGRGMTRVAKSGYRLLYNMVFRRMTSPVCIGKLKVAPADLTAANLKATAVQGIKQTKVAATFSKMLNRRVPGGLKRVANHVLHPGRFIGQAVAKKVEWILIKHGVDVVAIKEGMAAVGSQVAAAGAALSEFLIAALVVILIVIALLMMYEAIDLGGSSDNNNYSAAYVSAADGKDAFAKEIVDMLRGYTDDFIDELNNAQYNRSMYSGMTGYNTNEDVGSFEAGAYKVVFRGPDGEPIDDVTSVDLNNAKDIISMASVFIPTVFTKPGEGASEQAIAEYEKDKEHFKDYCTFLWAASHQVSIEEYHPGNVSNPDADDTSGLMTDAQTGKCQMDFNTNGDQGEGVNWWIAAGASPTSGELCSVCQKTDWYNTDTGEHACVLKSAADPCTHGHWQVVSTAIRHRACTGHHHSCSKHDYWYSCAEKDRAKWDKDNNVYKRVWVCDGHMGAVVYATIGRISRMPNFGAATDYDFDNPETYGGSGGIYSYFGGNGGEGSTAFHGDSYPLSEVQLRYLAAMCMGEQRSCATNEVTMRYQASLMANVYELYGKRKGLSIYEYLTLLPTQKKNGVSGWFATASHTYADKNAGAVSAQCVEWIRDVLCNGNRITKANEQGTLVTGFVKAVYQGKTYTGEAMKNESIYVSGETVLYTSMGQACLFEAFPGGHPAGCGTPVVDPFAIIIN